MPKETVMRFYNPQPHRFYCGVDLHARSMYLCILDHAGRVVLHKEVPAEPGSFLNAIAPFRDQLVVACECLFCWYWLADLCQAENIALVLGHALYMKAIHGGKADDDRRAGGAAQVDLGFRWLPMRMHASTSWAPCQT
jgi:hypothetical protein